jgi:hypothetical protein
MKTRFLFIFGIIIILFGFGSFSILSYLLDYGYLNNFLPNDVFMYARVDLSQLVYDVNLYGIFAYLRIGFLIIGFSGIVFIAIIGLFFYWKKRK